MSNKPAAADAAYIPDAEALERLHAWHQAREASKAAEAQEEAAWEALNALLDERVGPEHDAVLVTALGDDDPAKAGRTFPRRGAGIDYDEAAELAKDQLTPRSFARLFAPEKVTVYHPNIQALATARGTDEALDEILRSCTNAGTPTRTRVAPSRASKELVKAAVPLPAAAGAKGRSRPHVVA